MKITLALPIAAALLLPVDVWGEWLQLFNGRDLQGWDTSRSQRWTRNGSWTVEDGALVGRWDPKHPGPGWLLTSTEYDDFRLRMKFWISPGGNSGVAVRDKSRGAENPAYSGYEIQILSNDAGKKNPTGSIYSVAPAPAGGKLREGEWNDLQILCKGPRITVWLNGEEIATAADERSAKGAIGFQVHGRQAHDDVVKFKEIEIETY
jgi:hypothetical protein